MTRSPGPRLDLSGFANPSGTDSVPTCKTSSLGSCISWDELQHWDTLCRRPELPMAGSLTHFSFWREVIQAGRWVLEVVSHWYSIEFLQTPSVSKGNEHSTSTVII